MKTYTVLIRETRKTFRIRARSNKQALHLTANSPLVEPYQVVRVFQGGWGYDSGWKQKRDKFEI